MTDLRYPIGRFERPSGPLSSSQRDACITQIAETPARMRQAVRGLDDAQLDTPYRPDGWTVRQVAHHVPDSHMNAYVRFKLALTEDRPTIKTYDEKRWAELPEARTAPVDLSLDLLDGLHRRWTLLLRAMAPGDFARTLRHPEWGDISLDFLVAQYAWHGRHHVGHITSLRERKGWK